MNCYYQSCTVHASSFSTEIDKCNPNPCQHEGTCDEVIGGLGYVCKCPSGYNGQDCERKTLLNHYH